MPQPSDDHRRIQTGVIGHKDSDLAIILPMQARELAHWRQQHPDYMYWCGTLLGGCGEPLTDRLYHSKVCHFAHHPHHTCTRAANGENSADHLFMKQALHEWMRNQRLKGTVRLPRGTAPLGETIDVDLQGGQRRLRFQLRLSSTPSRGLATDEAAEVNGQHVDWIFGMGGPVPTRFLDEDGYVFRIQFETQGAKRCPYLGVQQRSGPITWEPFAEATLTDEGLTTRAVEEVRARCKRSITPPHSKSITDSSPGSASRSQAAKDMNGELVVALREALELDARWATRPTWKRLGQTVGTDFTRFSADDLRDLLAKVDGPFPPDAPVLSALIRTDAGGPLPYLGNILEALGLGLPSSASHLKRWSQREADRAFAKYGVPPRTMPPALPLGAAVPETFVRLPDPTRQPARHRGHQTGKRADDRSSISRGRLERLVARGQEVMGSAPGKTKVRLKRELRAARRLLESTRQVQLNSRGLGVLREAAAELENAITTAEKAARRHRQPVESAGRERRAGLGGFRSGR